MGLALIGPKLSNIVDSQRKAPTHSCTVLRAMNWVLIIFCQGLISLFLAGQHPAKLCLERQVIRLGLTLISPPRHRRLSLRPQTELPHDHTIVNEDPGFQDSASQAIM
ncbi:hypothetical protein LIA77_07619 [Sarocladium implicatum]|nr:hypothetical protein LIA77_07619 [Sarocladium implicatum]